MPTPTPAPSPTPPQPAAPPTPAPAVPATPVINPLPTTPPAPAQPTNTPSSVINKMNTFIPIGNGREKVVTLKNEVLKLKIDKTPIAFCFLLRSLFEISVKVYCTDEGIPTTTSRNGHNVDRTLMDLLTDATNRLTNNNTNHGMVRQLHGALAQLGTSNSLLSVTSMNQLVHNTSFSLASNDVCTLFHNIYPLLQALN